MPKLSDIKYEDMSTPRYQRATNFANQIQHLLREFLPRERACNRAVREWLLEAAFEGNLEIIEVPPHYDALTKIQLERAKLESHPAFIKEPL